MMDEMNILNLRNKLNKYGVIMSFTGPFSQGIIEEIGSALRSYLESKTDSKGEIFKVFSVFIEQTQNMKNYAYQLPDEKIQEEILLSGILNIGLRNDKYFVSSGNLVKKEDVKSLKNKLKKIKSYDKKELAKVYRKKLRDDDIDEENGAGLGLIEMARKASEKIKFEFEEVDENYEFFTLTIKI
ncbi:MAG TPA: SiaB family protein kinase [Halanaerobiales bacterium]|nr:SiaB family protein kinase [Halanaerobiales bacterium]